jgi:Ice-binding-like/Bacterial Ig-like domain
VPVNQAITATFSKPVDCTTLNSPATSFVLTGPATTVVSGTVSCSGMVATFVPEAPLAINTLFTATITTAVKDLAGNALAGNFVWSFRTASGATTPSVISVVPSIGATAVPINQTLTATFSEAMNPATITATTFTLAGPGGAAVTGTVAYVVAGSIATFTPAASLAASTVYTATITTGAKDLAGDALASNFVWTFTTSATPDTTKPTVTATNPANAATNVPINQAVTATFSKPVNPATISSTSFLLKGSGGAAVAGLVSYAGVANLATFTPTAPLAANTLFTATITTAVTDLAGNTLASNYVWTFTTGAAPNTTKPEITSTSPANGATGVSLGQAVSATFSEAMDPLTITTATFQLTGPGSRSIAATVTYDSINFIATLTPSSPLVASATYTATVTTGATDLAGNMLGTGGAPNPWSFTTGTVIIPPPVNLGTAALFGAFGGGAGITNQGTSTVINGDIGTTGVSTLITGFNDNGPGCVYTETPLNVGTVNGTIDTAPPPPTVACPTEGTAVTQAIAAQAAADALTAYNALVAFPNGLDVSTCPGCGGGLAGELGNRTLDAGIYKSAPGTYGITQGDLTLDAQGDPNAFWVFQMATTLTVGTPASNRNVILVNGAHAKNVFWQVGTAATINGILGGGTMQGTIIAQAGVSISTAGVAAVTTVNGRALVLTGPVTMVNTVINVPAQ